MKKYLYIFVTLLLLATSALAANYKHSTNGDTQIIFIMLDWVPFLSAIIVLNVCTKEKTAKRILLQTVTAIIFWVIIYSIGILYI